MKWEKYYSRPASESYIKDTENHKPFLLRIIREESKSLLKVGTGTANLSIFLSFRCNEVTSIDNNRKVLWNAALNNRSLNGKVKFEIADAISLPFEDDSFDSCFSQGFFEHFDDKSIQGLLKEQLRVAPMVFFSVPTAWYPVKEFGDERLMEREDWLHILSGFKVEKFEYYRFMNSKPLEIYFKLSKEV